MRFLTSLRFVRNDKFVYCVRSIFGLKSENALSSPMTIVIPNEVRNLPTQLKKISVIIFLFIFFSRNNSFSQGEIQVGSNFHYGFIIAHRESMGHLVKAHTVGYDINISLQTTGNKLWQQIYNYPVIGLKIYHVNLGNPEVLGNATAFIPYMNFNFIKRKTFSFGFDLGTGFGYIDKVFDRLENHKNNAIGTHINGIMHGHFEIAWNPFQNVFLHSSVGITHFSNGSYKIPNLGINIPTASIGLSYRFEKYKTEFKKDSIPAVNKKIIYNIIITGGSKEVYPTGSPNHSTFTLFINAIKPLGQKSKIGIGTNLFYDISLLGKIGTDSIPLNHLTIIREGIYFSHELCISKLSMIFQMGVYIIDNYKKDGFLYHRLGWNYQINKHLIANFTLKTHFAKADNLELGLGYKF